MNDEGLTDKEFAFICVLVSHGGVIDTRHRWLWELSSFDNLYNRGYVTKIKATRTGKTYVSEKNVWWNKRKATKAFVKGLRERVLELSSLNRMYSSRFVALTPIGWEFAEVNNLT